MKRTWFVAGILLLAFAGTAFAAPFQNGSFEAGASSTCGANDNLLAGSTAIPGWTVSVGSIDWAGPCNWASQEGSYSLDLIGGGASAVSIGGVQQTFDTVTGATYQVSFHLAANPSTLFLPVIKPLTVTVAGATHNYNFDRTGHDSINMGWAAQTFTFAATGPTSTINFVSDIGPSTSFAGAALDNVSIVRTFAATNTGLFSSANPSPFGSSVTFTVQVSGTVNSPTGTVNFTDNGVSIAGCAAVPLGPTGSPLIATADCTTPILGIGSHPIAATYSGDVVNASSGNTLTQVVNPVVIGATPWTGSAGTVVNAGQANAPIGSAPTVVSDGTAGPAVFTYATVNSFCCHTGDWTFETTAATSLGNVSLNWTYSGYHGTCQAQASLTAYIRRNNAIVYSAPVYSASDAACNYALPSGGFGEYGQVVFPGLLAGDAYGFTMHASNYDSNGGVAGSLTVTTGTVSTTTAVQTSASPVPYGTSVNFTATVAGSAPTGTVTFTQDGRMIAGCVTVPLTGASAVCTTNGLALGPRNILALYTGDTVNAGSVSAPLVQTVSAAGPAIATPALIRVVEDGGGSTAFVIGRVDNAPPPGTYVQAFTAASCVGGVPAGVSAIGLLSQSVPVTSSDGYFGATVPGVSSGQFLVISLTDASGTPLSGVSACLPSLSGNDFWTTALLVGGESTSGGLSSAGDYIDAPGKTRWYKFKVAPGQRIAVTLSGLPADYDLALFKDIGAAFAAQLAPADSAALTKLSAEFAPSAFSPSAFSPSAFSPSAFSPSAFSPSAFSPSAFSPSAVSPSAFSPSAFSPSAFSPSAFSPSAFSPSAFSPSAFSPSAFSPSAFSPSAFSGEVINTAFSSAQTRSIIAVSATPGTGDESAVVDSWNNSGYFYARVTGRGAAFSSTGQFNIGVAKGATSCAGVNPLAAASRTPGSSYTTVILTDSSVLADGALAGKLASFASRSEIAGVVVDLASDARVQSLKAQAAANSACPYATNLVAEEIKSIVDSYRNPNLKYVVLAGGDDVVPFFRYPDESLLGQESGYVPPVTGVSDASLRGDYVLSQDAYGSKTRISLRSSDFPVPGLAVGRLVKTPAEIAGMIDAYVAATVNGTTLRPGSSLVTGYDFLADGANAVTAELQAGTGVAPDQLIAANGVAPQDSWTATQLGAALFSRRHDVVFLAGHFSANSALAADFATNLITSDLTASTTDFTNSIVFSAGCHSGYSIVNRDAITGATFTLDWAQAFAQKQATLIAGTGYQYGDTDFIAYSERLYLNFAKELRAGSGPVAVGEALVKAKLDYLAATPDIRGIHKKALLESTLYGLPMLGVNMPSGRGGGSSVLTGVIAPAPVAAPAPASTLGLRIADLHLSATNPDPNLNLGTTLQTKLLTGATRDIPGPLASWRSGNVDGVVSNPAEPALPLKVVNVTPTDGTLVLRGVGFRGGSYGDTAVVPLTGAPATEIRGVHVSFASPYFFPMRPWTVNYFGALAGNGATSLLVTPAQHRAADLDPAGTGALRSTLRSFADLDLRLYYSGNYGNSTQQVSLSDAPTIVSAGAQQAASGGVTFTAQVTGDPAAAIHQVWALYTNGSGTWVPVDLAPCIAPLPPACGTTTDSQIWKGTDANAPPGTLHYVAQAANGLGLVSLDDNRGAYYSFTGTVAPPEAAATALSLVAAPTSASYGDAVSVTAQLTSGGAPVIGSIVTVNIGGMPNVGTTGSGGNVKFDAVVANAPGNYQIEASYLGNDDFKATSVKQSFAVSTAPASLTALPSPAIGVNLTAPVVTGNVTTQAPVTGQSVSFLLTSSSASQTVVVNTDTAGNATLPTSGLPAGTYSITASFLPASVAAGVTNYAGATQTLPTFVMNAQSVSLGALSTLTSLVYGSFVSFTVASDRQLPVAVSLSPGSAPYCALTGTGPTYTLSATAPTTPSGSSCSLVASAVGTTTIANASASRSIAITRASTATSLALSPSSAALGQTVTLTATISPAALSPLAATGTVQFFDGGNPVGTPVAIVNGIATFSSSGFTAGSHALTATYSGDGNYAASASTPASALTVNAGGTTTALTSSINPSVFGQSITLTATVTALGGGTPVGLVTFFDGATQLGTGNLSGGIATLATSALSKTGSPHALKAVYAGTASFQTSFGTLAQNINLAATGTTVTASANPAEVGQPVTLSATVVPVAPGAGAPTGTVTFKDNVTTLGSAALGGGGAASLATNALAAGGHPISAQYSGDSSFAGSASGPLTVNITGRSTATVLTADKTSPILFGTTINLTAAVTPGTATGTVSFLEGAATLGSATLTGGTTSTPARATFAISTLGIGPHTLTARYSGDPNDATSTSAALTLIIKESFTATGSMAQPRVSQTATLLNDGRVLVAGGSGVGDDDTRASRTTEIYCPDPYTPPATPVRTLAQWCPNGLGKWSPAGRGNAAQVGVGNLVQARTHHTATLLPDGTVLLAGGYDASGIATATAEIYDPTDPIADRFTAVANLPANAAAGHTATLVTKNSRAYVLVIGGNSASSQLFDTVTKTWSRSGSMAGLRSNHTASLVGTKVFVAGGTNVLGTTLQTTTIYDIAAGTFSSGPTMLSPRELHTASVIANGKVLLAGGRASAGIIRNTVALSPLAEIYDPGNATTPFAGAAFASGTGRFGHSTSVLGTNGQPDGRVLAAGGGVTVLCGQQLATTELYGLGGFARGAAMGAARTRHTATVLKDGRVLVAGGRGATGNNCGPLTTAEIWNGPPAP